MGDPLNRRLRRVALPFVLALLVSEGSTAETESVREKEYWATVARYAKGERAGAVASLALWTGRDIDAMVDSIESLARAAAKCEACEARRRFEALPLRAAVLLHAERDREDRIARINKMEGAPDCSARVHGAASERLVRVAALQPGGRDFAARFSAAMSIDFRAMLCFLGAERWADFGLESSPKDPALLMARGLVTETIGVTGYTEAPPIVTYESRNGREFASVRSAKADKTRRLNEAREAFEKALAIDPDQAEARLRLGRVLWRLGRGQEARERLRRAIADGPEWIRYLGHLFIGQCLEDSRDVAGAIVEYKASISLRPDSQVGAMALAHALSTRGDADGARDALEPALAYAGRRKTVDPYWLYLNGAPDTGETLLGILRLESLR
ncbi:MAG: tetratricopeptide repeat protein [Vicinamibacteria bacterium]|nr:tetratricopeptide repeat protein [Vicinamibacteria bacterium]